MPEFSIIIPVYNAEKTLERCLDSVCTQTYLDYEVVLIDDGSTDKSLEICKKYERENEKFHVIHQSNSGPSVARNAGLNFSTGKRICFVDSDDFIEESYLQDIWNVGNQMDADVVFIGYNRWKENKLCDSLLPDHLEETNIKTAIAFSEKDVFGYTWIKIFSREVIKNIQFDPMLNLFEDEVFTCRVFSNCRKIGIVNKPIYNYISDDDNSLIGRTHEDYCILCDRVYQEWKKMLEKTQEVEVILGVKANKFVLRCYYYAFEHQINIHDFFSQLSETEFFSEHTENQKLDDYVRKGFYKTLQFEKIKYQLKVRVSLVLHGKR